MPRPFKGTFNQKKRVKVTAVCPAGVGHERLEHQDNYAERLFRLGWQELHQGPMYGGSTTCDLLARLLAPYAERETLFGNVRAITKRDRVVAATVIQWLGSSVGLGFLRNVMTEDARFKRFYDDIVSWATYSWQPPRLTGQPRERHEPLRKIKLRR